MDAEDKARIQAALQQADLGSSRRDEISTAEEQPGYFNSSRSYGFVQTSSNRHVRTEHQGLLNAWSTFHTTVDNEEEELGSLSMGQSHRGRLQAELQSKGGYDNFPGPRYTHDNFPPSRGSRNNDTVSRGDRDDLLPSRGTHDIFPAARGGRGLFPVSKRGRSNRPPLRGTHDIFPAARGVHGPIVVSERGRDSYLAAGSRRNSVPVQKGGHDNFIAPKRANNSYPSSRGGNGGSPVLRTAHLRHRYRVKQGYGQGNVAGGNCNLPQPQTSTATLKEQPVQEDLLTFDSSPEKSPAKSFNSGAIPDLMDIDEKLAQIPKIFDFQASKFAASQAFPTANKENIAKNTKSLGAQASEPAVIKDFATVKKENAARPPKAVSLQVSKYAVTEGSATANKENIANTPKVSNVQAPFKFAVAKDFAAVKNEIVVNLPKAGTLSVSKYAVSEDESTAISTKDSSLQTSQFVSAENSPIAKSHNKYDKDSDETNDFWQKALPRLVKMKKGNDKRELSPPRKVAVSLSESRYAF